MKEKNFEQAAISPPGIDTSRKVSTVLEEAALLRANQLKRKENVMYTENQRGTIVQDIFEAGYLAAYGVEPEPILKENHIVYVAPACENSLRLRLDFRKSYIRTVDLADNVRRLQEKARLLRKKK